MNGKKARKLREKAGALLKKDVLGNPEYVATKVTKYLNPKGGEPIEVKSLANNTKYGYRKLKKMKSNDLLR